MWVRFLVNSDSHTAHSSDATSSAKLFIRGPCWSVCPVSVHMALFILPQVIGLCVGTSLSPSLGPALPCQIHAASTLTEPTPSLCCRPLSCQQQHLHHDIIFASPSKLTLYAQHTVYSKCVPVHLDYWIVYNPVVSSFYIQRNVICLWSLIYFPWSSFWSFLSDVFSWQILGQNSLLNLINCQ